MMDTVEELAVIDEPEVAAATLDPVRVRILDALAEQIGPASRYVHLGLTSSDVLDTSLALQMRDALDLCLVECDRALAALEKRAREHKRTVCVGRTHGTFAEPTTFGLKVLKAWDELKRNRDRLARAPDPIRRQQLERDRRPGPIAHRQPTDHPGRRGVVDPPLGGRVQRRHQLGDPKTAGEIHLLGQHGDPAGELIAPPLGERAARKRNGPGGRGQRAGEAAQERRLAAPVGAEERDQLAGRQFEVHAAQHLAASSAGQRVPGREARHREERLDRRGGGRGLR